MKKTPKKKSSSKIKVKHQVVELPSDNKEMESYVLTHRSEINLKIIDIIEYAVKNRLPVAEVFCFKGSNFVVMLHRKDFKENLENIYQFGMSNEKFDICIRVKNLINLVNKFLFIYSCKKKLK